MVLRAIWLAFGRLTSEHYFSEESGRQSLMWYAGMWRAAFYLFFLCVSFLTPLLFKKAHEHLNDQNAAAWLSAPVLSNLDGYVSASERGRHGWYTTQNRMHTRLHTHTQICPWVRRRSPDRRTPLGKPSSWTGQKSGKMCSPVEMQSIIQLSGTTSYLFGLRPEGKRPPSLCWTFSHSSTLNPEWMACYPSVFYWK